MAWAHQHGVALADNCMAPQGMLLVGFAPADSAAVEAWMQQMEPGFAVSHCTGHLLDGTVQQAISGAADGQLRRVAHAAVAEPLPRLVLLSGMSGEESVAVAEHWERFSGGCNLCAGGVEILHACAYLEKPHACISHATGAAMQARNCRSLPQSWRGCGSDSCAMPSWTS